MPVTESTPVALEKDTVVDVTAALSLTSGDTVLFHNPGPVEIFFTEKTTAPTAAAGGESSLTTHEWSPLFTQASGNLYMWCLDAGSFVMAHPA